MRLARLRIFALLLVSCNSILGNRDHYYAGVDAGTGGAGLNAAGGAGKNPEGGPGGDQTSGGNPSAGAANNGGMAGDGGDDAGAPGNGNSHEVSGNLLANGDFSDGLQNWNIRNNAGGDMPGTATVSAGQACIALVGPENSFSLGWPNDSSMALSLSAGTPYALSFQVSTTEHLPMFQVKLGENVTPFATDFAIENETPGGTLRTYAYPFRLAIGAPAAGVAFNFQATGGLMEIGTICFANVAIVSLNEPNDTTQSLPSVAAFVELMGSDASEQTGATVYDDGSAEVLAKTLVRGRYTAGDPLVQQFLTDLHAVGDISQIQTFPGCVETSATYVSVGRSTSGNLLCPPIASSAITALTNDAQDLTTIGASGSGGSGGSVGSGGRPGGKSGAGGTSGGRGGVGGA